MKRMIITLAIILVAGIVTTRAQGTRKTFDDHKYGNITTADFEECAYPESVLDDDAVILEHTDDILFIVDSTYRIGFNGKPQWAKYYHCYHTERYKIKIRKESGRRYAEVKLQHRHIANPTDHIGFLYGIQGYTYNAKGNSVTKSKLKPRDITSRMLDDSTMQIAFTMPNAAVGSIIEYEFEQSYISANPIDKEVIMQHDLPILKSKCILSMAYWDGEIDTFKAFLSDCYGDIPYRIDKSAYDRYYRKIYTEIKPEPKRDDPFAMRSNSLYRFPARNYMRVPTKTTIYEADNIPSLSSAANSDGIARVKIILL